jgi:hypothetical protein
VRRCAGMSSAFAGLIIRLLAYRPSVPDTQVKNGDGEIKPLDVVVSTVVLFVLAIAQPLLDLLGRNAEFFLARSSPALDIVLLAVGLTLVVPALLGLLLVWIGRLNEKLGKLLHGAVITFLAGVFALQVIELAPLSSASPWFELLLSLLIGLGAAAAFYRVEVVRSGVRFASIAPVIVLGLFIFTSSVSQLIFGSPAIAQLAEIAVADPTSVVIVVFDEMPVASFMDDEGAIQEDIYPSLAKLAQDGTWFRNAITVHQQTEESVPAILSGKHTQANKIPTAGDHPFTLFTLLADTYEIKALENVTDLCPAYACENTARPQYPMTERWSTLVDDLRIVAGHLFLPSDMTASLPPIDSSWSNFSGGEASEFDITDLFREAAYEVGRLAPIREFVDSIEPSDGQPTLFYLHALLPHVPWEYLPTGQKFVDSSAAPGSVSPGWGSDEWLVDQAYQRHLLQVGYVDNVVGQIIDRLESQDMYDDALVVVVADHGVTVRPNIYHRREATDETVGDIAAIPLFIKQPNQSDGGVDDYRAETIDVLPTIADALGIDVPWSVDGASLLLSERPERLESEIKGSKGVVVFGVDGSEARAIASRKIEHFGTDGPYGLAPNGHADLLGMAVATLTVAPADGYSAFVADPMNYRDVDVDGLAVPTWVKGAVTTPHSAYEHLVIGVAVNGRIAAVTRTYKTEGEHTAFGAMIPVDSLVDGHNEIALILIEGTGTTRKLSALTR